MMQLFLRNWNQLRNKQKEETSSKAGTWWTYQYLKWMQDNLLDLLITVRENPHMVVITSLHTAQEEAIEEQKEIITKAMEDYRALIKNSQSARLPSQGQQRLRHPQHRQDRYHHQHAHHQIKQHCQWSSTARDNVAMTTSTRSSTAKPTTSATTSATSSTPDNEAATRPTATSTTDPAKSAATPSPRATTPMCSWSQSQTSPAIRCLRRIPSVHQMEMEPKDSKKLSAVTNSFFLSTWKKLKLHQDLKLQQRQKLQPRMKLINNPIKHKWCGQCCSRCKLIFKRNWISTAATPESNTKLAQFIPRGWRWSNVCSGRVWRRGHNCQVGEDSRLNQQISPPTQRGRWSQRRRCARQVSGQARSSVSITSSASRQNARPDEDGVRGLQGEQFQSDVKIRHSEVSFQPHQDVKRQSDHVKSEDVTLIDQQLEPQFFNLTQMSSVRFNFPV